MKYTVVIRQPVADNVRANLEQQLVERFNLNPAQAQKLSSRRAGRLMKPTSQSRAELLLNVFQSVGAQVVLEEVREDGDNTAPQTFTSQSSIPPVDDAVLAPQLQNDTAMSDFMPPAQSSAAHEASAFEAPAQTEETGHGNNDPFATKMTDPDELPSWAKPKEAITTATPAAAASAATISATSLKPIGEMAATKTSETGASKDQAIPAASDDWADFAGAFSEEETQSIEKPQESKPRQTTEFLTAVTDDVEISNKPRSSLAKQIRLTTILPLILAGLLTLGLLIFTLPRLQDNQMKESATNLALTAGSVIDLSKPEKFTDQLEAMVTNPNVGFVRLETPDRGTIVKAHQPEEAENLARQLVDFIRQNPEGGRLDNDNYYVSRVAFSSDSLGHPIRTSVNADRVTHHLTVGLTSNQSSQNLIMTIVMVLISTLVGLALAYIFAARATRAVINPLERLVKVADAISLGDLTRPVKVERNDEVGDLAQALERMRLSLEAAMDRLRRRKRN